MPNTDSQATIRDCAQAAIRVIVDGGSDEAKLRAGLLEAMRPLLARDDLLTLGVKRPGNHIDNSKYLYYDGQLSITLDEFPNGKYIPPHDHGVWEALVVFKPGLARELGFRRKRAGHLFSKMRFLSLQLEAYLTDDLWLRLATHANAQAARLATGLRGVPGVEIAYPVDGNQIFVALPPAVREGLAAAGFGFSTWDDRLTRLVCAFNTDPADVDAFVAAARQFAERAA